RDDLARYQRAFHARMVHADAVGDRDGRERARRSAGFAHACVSVRGLLGEIAGAWRRLAGGGHDADERPRDGVIVEAHAAHEHAVGGAVDAVGGDPGAELALVRAAHLTGSPKSKRMIRSQHRREFSVGRADRADVYGGIDCADRGATFTVIYGLLLSRRTTAPALAFTRRKKCRITLPA